MIRAARKLSTIHFLSWNFRISEQGFFLLLNLSSKLLLLLLNQKADFKIWNYLVRKQKQDSSRHDGRSPWGWVVMNLAAADATMLGSGTLSMDRCLFYFRIFCLFFYKLRKPNSYQFFLELLLRKSSWGPYFFFSFITVTEFGQNKDERLILFSTNILLIQMIGIENLNCLKIELIWQNREFKFFN